MNKLLLLSMVSCGLFLSSCAENTDSDKTETKDKEQEIPEIVYNSVKIGTQEWMDTNLDVGNFRNGDEIPHAKTTEEWQKAKKEGTPAWCYYADESKEGYGRLYNWYAVADERGLAPEGWHVPSDEEWKTLEDFLGNKIGKKLKGTSDWLDDGFGDNSSGFNALPAGARVKDGSFNLMNMLAYWWSSTESSEDEAYIRALAYDSDNDHRSNYPKGGGYSVRCLKD